VRQLQRVGADVVISARNQQPIDQVADAVRGLGRRVVAVTADAGDPDDRERLARRALEHFGRVDVLVSNATSLVNVVAPGGMDEPGSEWERLRASEPERVAAIESSIPMGRLGRPAEVADCITFLVSERANWIVGHCLVVDGGQYPAVA
jgi:NAD(P)-dependent dehydrogenase (short-subunit alcohol dehydrogenase family)